MGTLSSFEIVPETTHGIIQALKRKKEQEENENQD